MDAEYVIAGLHIEVVTMPYVSYRETGIFHPWWYHRGKDFILYMCVFITLLRGKHRGKD
jgi:hypothetical protein